MLAELPLIAFAFSAGAGTFFAPCAYPLLPGYVSYYLGETVGSDGATTDGAGGAATDRSGGATTDGAGSATTDRSGGATTDGGTGVSATDAGVSGATTGTGSGPTTGPGTGRVATAVAGLLARVVPARHAERVVRATIVGVVVSVGFFLVYGVLAGITAALGSQVLGSISVLELVVGVILIVVGSAAAAGYDLPTPTVQLPERRRSVGGFLAFGVLYAAAAAGCTAPIFVGIGLQAVAAGPAVATATFAAYAAGMSLLMIGVTVGTALGRDALIGRMRGRTALVERGMGVLLVLAGIVQLYFFLFRFDGLSVLGLR
jgi:cytochrome c-type biogenesis protein